MNDKNILPFSFPTDCNSFWFAGIKTSPTTETKKERRTQVRIIALFKTKESNQLTSFCEVVKERKG